MYFDVRARATSGNFGIARMTCALLTSDRVVIVRKGGGGPGSLCELRMLRVKVELAGDTSSYYVAGPASK